MEDPLSRALLEAPRAHEDESHDDVSRHRTQHAPPLGEVLESMRLQLQETMSLPFFDAGFTFETTPITKVAHSETAAVTIIARKREPAYEATVSVEVRCDHANTGERAPEAGRYEVRALAHLRCDDHGRVSKRDVAVTVREIQGSLQLDALRLRDEMAAAIRSIGTAS